MGKPRLRTSKFLSPKDMMRPHHADEDREVLRRIRLTPRVVITTGNRYLRTIEHAPNECVFKHQHDPKKYPIGRVRAKESEYGYAITKRDVPLDNIEVGDQQRPSR